MKFRAQVEPPEPMKGLQVPSEIVEELDRGKRPRVAVTLNGHSWTTRIAIMRGRYLIGLSNVNRNAAGVEVGDEVEVDVRLDAEPVTVIEPEDFVAALANDPIASAVYDQLTISQKKQHVRAIENAKRPDTRRRRIEKALAALRESEPRRR